MPVNRVPWSLLNNVSPMYLQSAPMGQNFGPLLFRIVKSVRNAALTE